MLSALTSSLICICFIHHLGCMQGRAQRRLWMQLFTNCFAQYCIWYTYMYISQWWFHVNVLASRGLKGAVREGSDQVVEGQSCAYLVSFMLQSGARVRCFTWKGLDYVVVGNGSSAIVLIRIWAIQSGLPLALLSNKQDVSTMKVFIWTKQFCNWWKPLWSKRLTLNTIHAVLYGVYW